MDEAEAETAMTGLLQKFVTIEHDEHLNGIHVPTVFAFNHNNYLETVLIALFLFFRLPGRKVTFLVDWMYSQLPVIGWLVNRGEPVLIYNKKARLNYLNRQKPISSRQAALAECLQKLRNNVSIGIFPEGSRNPDAYTLRRGRQGVGALALQAGVPVVPVGVDFPARHRLGRVPALGRLILRIGTPLTFPAESAAYAQWRRDAGLPPKTRKRLERFVTARITHTIMVELSRLAGKTYPFAGPVAPPEAGDLFPLLKRFPWHESTR